MTLDDLRDEKQRLLDEKQANLVEADAIKRQIADAKARVHTHGEYSDPKWFSSANAALKFRTRRDQAIQTRLSTISKEIKKLNGNGHVEVTDKLFITAARLMLPRETYQAIMDMAVKAGEAQRGAL